MSRNSLNIYRIDKFGYPIVNSNFFIEKLETIKSQENSIEELKRILPILITNKIKLNDIFEMIYDISELKHLVYEILELKPSIINELSSVMLKKILENTVWGKTLVIHYLNNVLQESSREKIQVIGKYCLSNNCENEFINVFLKYENNSYKIQFFKTILKHKKTTILELENKIISKNELKFKQLSIESYEEEAINLNSDIDSENNLSQHVEVYINNNIDIKKIISLFELIKLNYKKNQLGRIIFLSNKLEIMKYLDDNIEDLILMQTSHKIKVLKKYKKRFFEKYKLIYELIELEDSNSLRANLNELLEYISLEELSSTIEKYLFKSSNRNFQILGSGATSLAIQIGDYVLKFGSRFDFKDINHYRIIPSIEIKIFNNSEKKLRPFVYEIQRKARQVEEEITDDMIYNLLVDLQTDGIETTDCNTLAYNKSNFGLLKNINDMYFSTNEKNNYSEDFLENQLVIIDRDLIYYENDKNKKIVNFPYTPPIKMAQSIEWYSSKIKIKHR